MFTKATSFITFVFTSQVVGTSKCKVSVRFNDSLLIEFKSASHLSWKQWFDIFCLKKIRNLRIIQWSCNRFWMLFPKMISAARAGLLTVYFENLITLTHILITWKSILHVEAEMASFLSKKSLPTEASSSSIKLRVVPCSTFLVYAVSI